MSILLTISVLALLALIWAGVSIVQHIRISRRRHNAMRDNQPALGTLGSSQPPTINEFAEYSFAALAPSPTRLQPQPATNLQPEILPVPSPVLRLITLLDAVQSAPEITQITPVPTPLFIAPRVEVITEPIAEKSLEFSPLLPAIPAAAIPIEPKAALVDATDRRPPTRALAIATELISITGNDVEEEAPELRRPVRSVQPYPSTPFIPLRRPDWVYFNKDMGDLSDPAPSRIREQRARAR